MKAVLCFVALALLVALVKADADTCVFLPPVVGNGGGCSTGPDAVQCSRFSFCNDDAVCQAWLNVGDNCWSIKQPSNTFQCTWGSACQGNTDEPSTMKCVEATFPGSSCGYGGSYSLPQCGTGDCNNGRCISGSVGDTCFVNSDCLSNSCVGQVCKPIPDGANCTSPQCTPGVSFCDLTNYATTFNGTCKARQTSGTCDPSNNVMQCKLGYSCVRTDATNSSITNCVADGSLKTGSLCFDSQSCESDLCSFRSGVGNAGYCAAGTPTYCTPGSQSQCGNNQACACSSQAYDGGILGTCQNTPCEQVTKDYSACMDPVCAPDYTDINYPFFNGSCAWKNCYNQYIAYAVCGSASGLSASFLLVSVMAVAVSLFSKKF